MSWAKSKQHDAAAKRLEAQQRMDLEMQFILLCAAAAEAWQLISMGSVCVFEMHGLFAGSKLHRKALYRSIISMANMPSSLTHMLRACTTKVCRAIIVVHQSAARAQRVECIGCAGDMWPTVEHAMLAARISDQLTKSKILDTPDIEKARQVSAAAQRRVCRFAERL